MLTIEDIEAFEEANEEALNATEQFVASYATDGPQSPLEPHQLPLVAAGIIALLQIIAWQDAALNMGDENGPH